MGENNKKENNIEVLNEEKTTNEKKKHPVLMTAIIILLLFAFTGIGFAVGSMYIVGDAKAGIVKNCKSTENASNEKTTKKETKTQEETTTQEDTSTNQSVEDDNKYTERVYSSDDSSIVLFKSGKCVLKNKLEYTANCSYNIDNNTITITSHRTGPGDNTEYTSTYNTTTENNEEYIVLSTDNNKKYKLLK